MARTSAGAALTDSHRRQQQAIRDRTTSDVLRLWVAFDPQRIDETWEPLKLGLLTLTQQRRQVSAALAARYYQAMRVVEGAAGDVSAVPAVDVADGLVDTSLDVTGPVGYKVARRYGRTPIEARQVAAVKSAGAVTRIALGGGRDTITRTMQADPATSRWARVTSGSPCKFCAMLAGRGAVYSADTADFQPHDHCACMAEPAF